MKKILVTGVTGQVGWELQRSLAPLGAVVGLTSQQLNLADPDAIRACLRALKPAIIVNPAAYTAVDLAESQVDLCMAVNAAAPRVFAEEAKRLNALFVHYSTDYVFDGKSTVPYNEDDATNPLSVYGRSKLEGEHAIASTGCKHLIVRTSWVYGMRGKNFLLTMLRLAKEKEFLKIVSDQVGTPTWSRMIAQATAHMVAHHDPSLSGIYHLASGGKTNWSQFAEAIFDFHKQKYPDVSIPKVTPITTSEYPTPAVRPLNSLLDQDKLYRNFGLAIPDWKDVLQLCLS